MSLVADLPGIQQSVMLAPYTTFKIGGPADWFFKTANVHELSNAIKFADQQRIPFLILGNGSNILVSDTGFRGLAIAIRDKRYVISNTKIRAAAGLSLTELVNLAAENSLSGLEFLTGIPGSVGGSVRGNAGAWQQSIGDKVLRVQYLNQNGKMNWLDQKACQFAYRQSRFKQSGEIILAAELQLVKGNQGKIRQLMAETLAKRADQPPEPSAGCVFINPKLQAAGKLIEECGLKGKQIGQAQISPQHANFIINLGNAKAEDVLALIELAKKAVLEKFNLNLELEIQLIGFNHV